jgi:hypothetical protein
MVSLDRNGVGDSKSFYMHSWEYGTFRSVPSMSQKYQFFLEGKLGKMRPIAGLKRTMLDSYGENVIVHAL